MNKPFVLTDPHEGYSLCIGCEEWRHCLTFFHEGRYWTLCINEWGDYWENCDTLQDDYIPPTNHKKGTRNARMERRK